MLYAVFFNSSGPVVKVPCPSGHTVTGRFYKNSVLKKVNEFYNKKRPSKGWSGVHLLHDNASSHKCEVVKSFFGFCKGERFKPPTLFTWPESLWLKKMLSGNKYTSRSSLCCAIYQCPPTDTKRRLFICFSRLGKKVTKMCFSKGRILWRFVIKICLMKRSTEVIRTQWQNFLQDPHTPPSTY